MTLSVRILVKHRSQVCLQLVDALVVCVVPDTVVNLEDVVPDEPDQVGEVGGGRLVRHELQHPLVLNLVHVEAEGPDRYPDHALAVVEELDGLGVEGEVVIMLVIEEVDGVLVQPEAEGLEEGDVVGHDLLVGEVELVNNDGVDVVVGEEIVDAGVVLDVLEEDVQSLKQLDTDIVVASLLIHKLQEE